MLGSLITFALTLIVSAAVSVGPRANEPQIQKRTVVSVSPTRLVMKDIMGKEQSFTIDYTTNVTVNGQLGKLEDLQETMPIQVALDEKGKVITVSTIDKEQRPALATTGSRGMVPCVVGI
jgi:hypothetical protein